ncbi:large ribosomal subunit protein mL50 [Palaemon carinicauda]|uniref:large ribosomal subunit protein mL50 n=1 Tax=Palaemon carinicauda TaxID=392227 RepID=UPI0035B6261D
MAAITKFRLLHILRNTRRRLLNEPLRCSEPLRCASSVTSADNEGDILPRDRKLDFDAESLAARGYLRNQKPYTPPDDVDNRILQCCEKYMGKSSTFVDAETKFKVLRQCSQNLKHAVPNSLIHKITNIDELRTFYNTPVNTTVPLDMMKDMNLPKNLHVIYKYHRFHPETDTKFGGKSAYPNDTTIVSGLKYKKKYPGYVPEPTVWHEK